MKKIIPAFTITSVFTIAFIFTNAQKIMDNSPIEGLKNLVSYVTAPQVIPATKAGQSILYKINIKAVRDFMKAYPAISNEKWEVLKEGFMVSFVSDSIWTKHFYDKKGRWFQSINQYKETKLPKDIRASVKSIYYDYAITTIKEVNEKKIDQEPVYFIHLKYDDTFKIIRVVNGELDEVIP